MRKYLKEIVILVIQLLLFYVFPLTAGPTDVIGMVVLIIIGTFVLSIVLGSISNNWVKLLYPPVIAILFIPSVFIYYNESALIHAVWYLVIGTVGMLIGALINKIVSCIRQG